MHTNTYIHTPIHIYNVDYSLVMTVVGKRWFNYDDSFLSSLLESTFLFHLMLHRKGDESKSVEDRETLLEARTKLVSFTWKKKKDEAPQPNV